MTDTEKFHAMALTGMGQFQEHAVKDNVKRVQHPNSWHQDDGTNFLRHWHYVQLLSANENGLSATSKAKGASLRR